MAHSNVVTNQCSIHCNTVPGLDGVEHGVVEEHGGRVHDPTVPTLAVAVPS